MGQHSDRARAALLDAAEELFAEHGVDAVSNRRIAEHAGTANHSAIAYHFGGREELLRALVTRYAEPMRLRRAELVATLGDEPALRDVVACGVLPWIEQLESLERPSWRARFLFQVRGVPSVTSVMTESLSSGGFDYMLDHTSAELAAIPRTVLRNRSGILGSMVLGVCSEVESRIASGSVSDDWRAVGYFLIDAIAGMLAAPVTDPADFRASPASPSRGA